MPIASLKCPKCGAKINKSISDSSFKKQELVDDKLGDIVVDYFEVTCPRCKDSFPYLKEKLDNRCLDSIEEYKQSLLNLDDNSRFEEYVLDDGGDSVEEALMAVEEEFEQTAAEFDSGVDTSIPQIDFEETISDEKIDELMSTFSSKMRSRVKSDSALVDKAFEYAEEIGSSRLKELRRKAPERVYDKASSIIEDVTF